MNLLMFFYQNTLGSLWERGLFRSVPCSSLGQHFYCRSSLGKSWGPETLHLHPILYCFETRYFKIFSRNDIFVFLPNKRAMDEKLSRPTTRREQTAVRKPLRLAGAPRHVLSCHSKKIRVRLTLLRVRMAVSKKWHHTLGSTSGCFKSFIINFI